MNILIISLLVLAGIIVLLLLVALFARKDYRIRRDIIIHAPKQAVFDYVKLLKNQDHFNKWVMVDPGMKREFRGTDGTVGFVYAWNGNKQAGEGELEIKAMSEGASIDTEIRFKRPFTSLAHVRMETEALADAQTKISWSNASTMVYPLNLMLPMIENMLAKDMDTSLQNLKAILEK